MGTVLHVAHGAIIAIGVLAVAAMLLPTPGRRNQARRSVEELRRAAQTGDLIALAERRAASAFAPAGPAKGSGFLAIAFVASLTAAVIHAVVCPEHFAEGVRLGMFFLIIAIVQLLLPAFMLRRPSRRLVLANVLINAATIGVWILTRTVGLPFDLAEVEPVGTLDVLASVAEGALVLSCAAWFATSRRARQHVALGEGSTQPPRSLFPARGGI